ncbi:MAG: hypothetical protein M0Q92_02850 [Methanoregula sp.]|jgi:hypothetical protein|nr:hypothetical protein [Methanoregula sp.]
MEKWHIATVLMCLALIVSCGCVGQATAPQATHVPTESPTLATPSPTASFAPVTRAQTPAPTTTPLTNIAAAQAAYDQALATLSAEQAKIPQIVKDATENMGGDEGSKSYQMTVMQLDIEKQKAIVAAAQADADAKYAALQAAKGQPIPTTSPKPLSAQAVLKGVGSKIVWFETVAPGEVKIKFKTDPDVSRVKNCDLKDTRLDLAGTSVDANLYPGPRVGERLTDIKTVNLIFPGRYSLSVKSCSGWIITVDNT